MFPFAAPLAASVVDGAAEEAATADGDAESTEDVGITDVADEIVATGAAEDVTALSEVA